MKKILQFLDRREIRSLLLIVTCLLLAGIALTANNLANDLEAKFDTLQHDFQTSIFIPARVSR